MTSWIDLATENRAVAYELFNRYRWRSCASRVYYAVYANVTHLLISHGTTMPVGRNNPRHEALPNLVGYNLNSLLGAKSWRLSDLVGQLYKFRIIADYQPSVTLAEDEARICIGMMQQCFGCLKDVQ